MAAPAHVIVRCNGSGGFAGGGFDIFSFGFSMRQTPAEMTPAIQSQIADDVAAYFVNTKSWVSAMGVLEEVTFANVNAAGVQIGDTARYVRQVQGNANGPLHPPQITARVSLSDGLRGRSHRGGWYMPYTAWQISNTSGVCTGTQNADLRDSTVAFIRAVNAHFGAPGTVSPSVVIAGAAGLVPVTTVRVGNALDTIRTRRNAIKETYSVATV
jgi:hypothetical protein